MLDASIWEILPILLAENAVFCNFPLLVDLQIISILIHSWDIHNTDFVAPSQYIATGSSYGCPWVYILTFPQTVSSIRSPMNPCFGCQKGVLFPGTSHIGSNMGSVVATLHLSCNTLMQGATVSSH